MKGRYYDDEDEYTEKHHPLTGYDNEEGLGCACTKAKTDVIDLDLYEDSGRVATTRVQVANTPPSLSHLTFVEHLQRMPIAKDKESVEHDIGLSRKPCKVLFRDTIDVPVVPKKVRFHDPLGDFVPLVDDVGKVVIDYLDTLEAKGAVCTEVTNVEGKPMKSWVVIDTDFHKNEYFLCTDGGQVLGGEKVQMLDVMD